MPVAKNTTVIKFLRNYWIKDSNKHLCRIKSYEKMSALKAHEESP